MPSYLWFSTYPIEIKFTSGSVEDLEKYRALGIKEVWMWQEKEKALRFFVLGDRNYVSTQTSRIFPEIITAELLSEFLQTATSIDNLTLETDFTKAVTSSAHDPLGT